MELIESICPIFKITVHKFQILTKEKGRMIIVLKTLHTTDMQVMAIAAQLHPFLKIKLLS